MPFSINSIARSYVYKRFPQASFLEKEKIINDWLNKIKDSHALVEDFRKRVGDPRDKKIIDAGCGNGGLSIAFALAGAKVCGIDIEKELFEIAKGHAIAYQAPVDFFLYDGFGLPFDDNTFDYAVSVSVLEHTDDPVFYLSEILRVLQPGGKLYLAFPNKLWPKETHTQIWFLTYLPSFLRLHMVRLLRRNPLTENNLHFYSYLDLKKMINEAKAESFMWQLMQEEGQARTGVKKFIKNFLGTFGISYKSFLSHISVVLIKTNIHEPD